LSKRIGEEPYHFLLSSARLYYMGERVRCKGQGLLTAMFEDASFIRLGKLGIVIFSTVDEVSKDSMSGLVINLREVQDAGEVSVAVCCRVYSGLRAWPIIG
jgi:hypothetical protein